MHGGKPIPEKDKSLAKIEQEEDSKMASLKPPPSPKGINDSKMAMATLVQLNMIDQNKLPSLPTISQHTPNSNFSRKIWPLFWRTWVAIRTWLRTLLLCCVLGGQIFQVLLWPQLLQGRILEWLRCWGLLSWEVILRISMHFWVYFRRFLLEGSYCTLYP